MKNFIIIAILMITVSCAPETQKATSMQCPCCHKMMNEHKHDGKKECCCKGAHKGKGMMCEKKEQPNVSAPSKPISLGTSHSHH